jgi:hypothetical protein
MSTKSVCEKVEAILGVVAVKFQFCPESRSGTWPARYEWTIYGRFVGVRLDECPWLGIDTFEKCVDDLYNKLATIGLVKE